MCVLFRHSTICCQFVWAQRRTYCYFYLNIYAFNFVISIFAFPLTHTYLHNCSYIRTFGWMKYSSNQILLLYVLLYTFVVFCRNFALDYFDLNFVSDAKKTTQQMYLCGYTIICGTHAYEWKWIFTPGCVCLGISKTLNRFVSAKFSKEIRNFSIKFYN